MSMEPMLFSYNDNSVLQATCQKVGNPMLANMAAMYGDQKAKADLKSVRIAEYGCSGGRNSCAPMEVMIASLRDRVPALRVECILEDLPSNPWSQVMEEYPRLTANFNGSVQVLCAGNSFYNQICADESVDLAYSYVSAHFLSDSRPMTSHVLMHEANAAERVAWEAQAAKDWENFLLLRAHELKKGGKIMISTMSRDGAGYSWKEFSNVFWDCAQRAESLSRQATESICIPACLRSEAELLAPLGPGTPAGNLFEVDSLQFLQTDVAGERDLPINVLAPLLRRRIESVWGGMFLTQLAQWENGKKPTAVMKEVWDSFEDELSRDVTRGWLDMRCFYLQLTKK